MPPRSKRRADAAAALDEATAEAKKYKSAIDAMADELCCPITCELPLDPVTAEDGRVYERSAIEEWFASRPAEARVKSPVTNELMGKRLLSALQVRNTIKGMVRSGAISGAKAEAWKVRMEQEEAVTETRRKAESGDTHAMRRLGNWYCRAKKGLAKDDKHAFAWFKKAWDLGDYHAMAVCGYFYLEGVGVERDAAQGMLNLAEAAMGGSEWACFNLGLAFEDGYYDLKKDEAQAAKWYRKMPGCAFKINEAETYRAEAADEAETYRAEAAEFLRKYDAAGSSS